MHDRRGLKGVVITHMGNFVIARTADFVERVRKGIVDKIIVFKVEKDRFRFT